MSDQVWPPGTLAERSNRPQLCGPFHHATFEIREAFAGGDGTARMRSRLVGRDAIANYVGNITTRVCPFIYNLLIDVSGSRATSNCLMTTLVWSSSHQIVGEYQDAFQYDTRWRFTARIYTVLGEFSLQPAQRPER
jgi:SnoaL-like domain